MDILVDFDGTCVTHEFPSVGHDIGAAPVLKRLVEAGHNLILFTMRSNRLAFTKVADKNISTVRSTQALNHAIQWFFDNDIPLYGVQTHPTQNQWTESPKAYGHLIIDDTGLGTPVKYDLDLCDRPFVDWEKAEKLLEESGVLPRVVTADSYYYLLRGLPLCNLFESVNKEEPDYLEKFYNTCKEKDIEIKLTVVSQHLGLLEFMEATSNLGKVLQISEKEYSFLVQRSNKQSE